MSNPTVPQHFPSQQADGHVEPDPYQVALHTLTRALMAVSLASLRLDPATIEQAPAQVYENFQRAAKVAMVLSDTGRCQRLQAEALRDVVDTHEIELGDGRVTVAKDAIRFFLAQLESAGSVR